MDSFSGQVSVVTGGASGIGFAIAQAAAARGSKVVIADVREDALADALGKLQAAGVDARAVRTDVASSEQVEGLAEAAVRHFGKVNLLFNNAGVFSSGIVWETSFSEFEWIISVNLKSVINGIKSFVPRMIAQGDPCHVINTASGAALTVRPGFGGYSMTKHAVLALSEALYLDLATLKIPNIGVTIVMPGVVQSAILAQPKEWAADPSANRPARAQNSVLAKMETALRDAVDTGMPSAVAAEMVFRAITEKQLYVLPNFDDVAAREFTHAVALGRCDAVNPYLGRFVSAQFSSATPKDRKE
jgi:NAD(P)-dependent dehydrogenase (short-subunit alcohol dehydrogenase family)